MGAGSAAQPTSHLICYTDYNGVLNIGEDTLVDMAEFLVNLDYLKPDISIRLLSFGGPRRREQTLQDLAEAGIIDIFDKIIFTEYRVGADLPADASMPFTEQRIFHAHLARPLIYVNYEIFHGGKDQCILLATRPSFNETIMFVDDKARILEATLELMPSCIGVEMRHHKFFTNSNIFHHVRTLTELKNTIAICNHL